MRDLLGDKGGSTFRRLQFVPAQRGDDRGAQDCEFHCLNPEEMPSAPERRPGSERTRGDMAGSRAAFCKESSIQLQWTSPRKAGSGLINLGNTCFMNSVLQCLTHTPPLAELCLQQQSLSNCPEGSQQLDPIAATQAHIRRALTSHTALQPKWHARNLKAINRRFRLGRQEDAHEYLRCVLDAMHEAFLRPIRPKPSPELAATTFVHRIFGGKLRSQVQCEGVDYSSSTFDPFLDLSLEINKANSLVKALTAFTAAEVLDGDNRYRCPTNNKLVRAHKRISIDDAPNVLTIHLKRFDFFGRGHKLSKRVEFGLELDLGPYMTQHHHRHHHGHHHHHKHHARPGKHHHAGSGGSGLQHQHSSSGVGHNPLLYDLYAVLVHHGHSLHSGHYVCYVRAGNGIWHLCDDHRVAQVSQRVVEGQQAYILFYVRRQAGHPAAAAQLAAAAGMAARQAAATANRSAAGQPTQPLPGSDSTRTPLTAVGQAAAAAAAAGQQQQQAVAAGPPAAGQSGSASAAEEQQRKVVTSSTESTANASPGSKEPLCAGAVDSAPHGRPQHHHHHYTRSRPPPLGSFERHMQLHRNVQRQRTKLREKQLRGKQLAGLANLLAEHSGLAAAATAAAAAAAGTQAAAAAAAAAAEAAAGGAGGAKQGGGVSGNKRSRPEPEQPQLDQQQQPAAVVKQKQKRHQKQQQPQADAQEHEQQEHHHHHHHHKRHKHPDAPSSQQQQQQQQQPPSAVVAGSKAAASSSSLQQQQRPGEVVVTGAAALDLLMAGPAAAGGGGAAAGAGSGWGDGAAAAGAAGSGLQQRPGPGKRAVRDEWDVEYDRGKVKKVRKPKAEEEGDDEGGNRFQRAWDEGLPQKGRAEAWKGRGQAAQQQRGGRGRGRGGGGGRGGRFGGRGGGGRGGGGRGGGGRGGRGGGSGRGGGRGRGRGGPRFG